MANAPAGHGPGPGPCMGGACNLLSTLVSAAYFARVHVVQSWPGSTASRSRGYVAADGAPTDGAPGADP